MSPKLLVSSAAQVSEVLEVGTLVSSPVDDKGHVWSEHKWGTIPGYRCRGERRRDERGGWGED